MLEFHADQLLLNRKLMLMVRQWSIYQLGVLKLGWNETIKDVALENRKIQDFVFDPNGYVDAYGDFSSWLGERIYVPAQKLCDLFPKRAEYIKQQVMAEKKDPKMGTEVCYTEWWNDDYCFTTFKKKVLDKHKNEFYRYPEAVEDENGVPQMNLMGEPIENKPRNHFAVPKKPYVFMSVFSLQERPHDITGLIEQNIGNQQLIHRRVEQLDSNLSQSNNGIAFSENNFTQETAKQASNALTKGVGKVLVPQGGPIGEAIVRIPAPGIPNGFFDELENNVNNLRSSWGTQGITSQQQKPDETARGMILNQSRDTSRIGGGIGDVVEQSVARNVFNWLVQLYLVFYDKKHFGAVMGQSKATEYVQLQSSDIDRQLIVGVSPNSMKPRDRISQMNQATQLYEAGAIGPKTLLDMMDYPNADESAADGVLWKMSLETDAGRTYIQLNFPELWQQLQQILQQQAAEQQQAQQQEMAQQAQAGQAQLQQKGAQAQQGLSQSQAAHEQKLKQEQESHTQKMTQATEAASLKMSQMKNSVPK
jgi:hypothetical protein